MPDLTLSEFNGLSPKSLKKALKLEIKKMYGVESLENGFGDICHAPFDSWLQRQKIGSLISRLMSGVKKLVHPNKSGIFFNLANIRLYKNFSDVRASFHGHFLTK